MELKVLKEQEVVRRVVKFRGEHVLLDRDVAELYGVETREVNQAVRNNPDKFPDGYMMELSYEETKDLRSKFLTANISPKSRVAPKVFTEKGLYMLATILKSRTATETTFAIIESFSRLREISRNMSSLQQTTDPSQRKDLARRTGELLSEMLIEGTETTQTETMLEVNLLALKLKHTITRKKK